MIKNWVHLFIYQVKNNQLFTIVNILGLSLGIAGLIFAILYWNEEHSYNDWNPEKDRVFQSISKVSNATYWPSNVAAIEPYFKTSFPEIEAHCYFDNWYYEEIVQYKTKKEIIKVTDAQSTFFEFFPFPFLKGSPQTALKDASSIVLSEETAKRIFGSEEPMGKQVMYSRKVLVVNGVYRVPGKSSMAPMAVTNLIESKLEENRNHWGNFNHGLLLKLKNPKDKAKVAARFEKIMFENRVLRWAKEEGITPEEWLQKNGDESTKIILEPLSTARLHSVADGYAEGKGNFQFLAIMMGISLLILVLSIVNYINMATASAIKRAKEIGVRKILGASRAHIIGQFLMETSLITLFSLLLSLVIVEWSLPFYNDFLSKNLRLQGEQLYLQLIGVFCITVVVAGIFPAVYVSQFETLKVLKGNFGRSKSGSWLRNGMLILQFAIATFFVIGSYIVNQQVQFLSSKDLGFRGEQVLSIRYRNTFDWREKDFTKKMYHRYESTKKELLKIKGVTGVATGAFVLGDGSGSSSSYDYNGVTIQGQNMGVDFGMLEMMKIQLKEGRHLSEKFASDTINSMLINEQAMLQMKEPNPIGKVVEWNGTKLKIVGVVKDFSLYSPQADIPPMVFFHFKTIDWMLGNASRMHVKIEPKNMETTIAAIEQFWKKKVDSEYPFEYDFVDKAYARTYQAYVKQRNLFALLNVLVIVIALFGLFSLASFSIQRRMKEIAIRKTLGADTALLLKELSRQYVLFSVIGFLLALFPVYFLLNSWLENFAYRITIDAIPFVIGFLILLLLTLAVVLLRAYWATRLDVLKFLKYE